MTITYCIMASLVVGWLINRFDSISQRQKEAAKAYELAISFIKATDWHMALFHLSKSIGKYPACVAYEALGIVWGHFERWNAAADAYRDARVIVERETGILFSNQKKLYNSSSELICRLFECEARSYARNSSWEFAYRRSSAALCNIREDRIPRYTNYGDGESWLRSIHMVAAIQFLPNNEALSKAKEDAEWILKNSLVTEDKYLADYIVNSLLDITQLREQLLEKWLSLDIPKRNKAPFIIDSDNS